MVSRYLGQAKGVTLKFAFGVFWCALENLGRIACGSIGRAGGDGQEGRGICQKGEEEQRYRKEGQKLAGEEERQPWRQAAREEGKSEGRRDNRAVCPVGGSNNCSPGFESRDGPHSPLPSSGAHIPYQLWRPTFHTFHTHSRHAKLGTGLETRSRAVEQEK